MQETNFADLVLTSQAMIRGIARDERPQPGGVAIKGRRILAVGAREELRAYIGPQTEIRDFGADSLLMPGFSDGHFHLGPDILAKSGPRLYKKRSERECVESAVAWYETHPDAPWIVGMNWNSDFWNTSDKPDKKMLSDALPDVPALFINTQWDMSWVNQKALDVMGYDRNTPDPEIGKFCRDENGELTGYLEGQAWMVPFITANTAIATNVPYRLQALKDTIADLNRLGVTSALDACEVDELWYQSLEELRTKNELGLRLSTTVWLNSVPEYMEAARTLSRRFPDRDDLIWFWGFKLITDGVPDMRSAWMSDDYADAPGECGAPIIDTEKARLDVLTCEKEGYGVHIHACGSRAVEYSLDLFAEARKQGLTGGHRNAIAHCFSVNQSDFARFGELDVVPVMQPEMLSPTTTFADNPYPARMGDEGMRRFLANRSLMDNANAVSFGSDSAVITPMDNIHRAILRVHNDNTPPGGINPEQALTLSECLWAYTYGGAYQLAREDILGTLEPGKLADVIVLDRNLFETRPEDILGTVSLLTVVDGRITYTKE